MQMPDTCSAYLLHAIQEHNPCCVWYSLSRCQKMSFPPDSLKTSLFKTFPYTSERSKEKYSCGTWRPIRKSLPMVLNHPLQENIERNGRLWRQLFLCQDSVPSHQLSSNDQPEVTASWCHHPDVCAVPGDADSLHVSLLASVRSGLHYLNEES